MDRITKPRADFVSVLEAAYAPEPDADRWAQGLLAAVEALLAAPVGVSTILVALYSPDHFCMSGLTKVAPPALMRGAEWLPPQPPQPPRRGTAKTNKANANNRGIESLRGEIGDSRARVRGSVRGQQPAECEGFE